MRLAQTPISAIGFAVLGLCLLSLIYLHPAESVMAQSQPTDCPQMSYTGQSWPKGQKVYVYFYGYTSAEQDCIKTALANWQGANGSAGTNSGVTFDFSTPSPNTSDYTILFDKAAPDRADARAQYTIYYDNAGNVKDVTIRTSPGITNCQALTLAASHEIGHTFGLGECASTCHTPKTAMSSYDPTNGFNDTSVGSAGPTPCDDYAVREVYYAPTLPGGGGGGPDPDCCGGGYYDPGYYGRGSYQCYDYYEAHDSYTCAEYQGQTECEYQGTEYYYVGTYCY